MQKILFLAIAVALSIIACNPKSGDKMSGTKTTMPAPGLAAGKAPMIPLPTGDVRAKAPKAGDAPKIQIGKAETFQLDNGLTVIVVENHKLPKVSYRVFVDNDPVPERDAAGYVDMVGELLNKGTKTRTKAQIDEEVDFIGASLNTSPNGVSGESLTKHSEKLLGLMSDVLLNPTFPAEELDKAKRREEANLEQAKSDANQIAARVGAALRFTKNHPYGESTTEESLAKINLEQVRNYYNTFFKPNISYLVVVGDVTRDKVEQQAKKYFGKWAKGDVPKSDYGSPRPPDKTQVDFVHKPGAVQSVISITYPVDLAPGSPDAIRARLLNAVLGGYFNSRVNANLREGHGWTYGARTNLRDDKLVGSFNATAAVRNAVTDSAVVEFIKEMERLTKEKVPAAELQVVKNVLTGQFSQDLEEPGTVANFALNIARYHLPADYYEKYLETLQAVSAEEVLLMAKKYLRPDRAHILVVGSREEVADRLKPLSPDKKVNFYDTYGNPMRSVNIEIPPGVTGETVVEDYLNAIGGRTKISMLKDISTIMTMKSRGPEFVITTYQKGGDRLATDVTMNGQSVNKRVLSGGKALESGMGGATRPLEGADLLDLKEQAAFVKEAAYKSAGYQLALKGIEDLDGKNAYVLEVTRPDGKKTTEYYELATALKLREVSSTTAEDGTVQTTTTDFADYKDINGVKFPQTLMLGGMFPVPMKATVTEQKVNAGVDDKMFEMK